MSDGLPIRRLFRRAAILRPCVLVVAVLSRSALAQSWTPKDVVKVLVANEEVASRVEPACMYVADQRSDRTGGKLWEERVVETSAGKLRYLVAIDGKALDADQRSAEIKRLRAVAADPSDFISQERARKDDEERARKMLGILPIAFKFQRIALDDGWIHLAFAPDPAYLPKSREERVIHEMSGTISIDPKTLRLHQLAGQLNADVSFGFGILAVIRKGGKLTITREQIAPELWKTTNVDADIEGRALLLKIISTKQETVHKDFKVLPTVPSIAQGVDLILR